MTRRRLLRARRVTVAALVLTVGVVGTPALAAAPQPRLPAARKASTLILSVLSVTPSTPAITSTPSPLTIVVAVRNTTAQPLTGVSLAVVRSDPVTSQKGLNASLADTAPPTSGLPVPPRSKTRFTVPADQQILATFRTTTSTLFDERVCLCAEAGVYPLDVSAHVTTDGQDRSLGSTRTYLPAFDTAPQRQLGVSWVWPIIDRPHRAGGGSEFLDDDLAQSVSSSRLSHILDVVEAVADVPMTLLIDPELIDELEIMATGRYTVASSSGTPVPGTGQQAALGWLTRLRTVLAAHPTLDVQLTPYADPDVTRLSQHDLSWTSDLPTAVATRVSTALGRPLQNSVAVPPGGGATAKSLDRIAANGADTVVLSGQTVSPATTAGVPAALARLRTSSGTVNAALTSSVLQGLVSAVVTGSDVGKLPQLAAELAVRVAQNPTTAQVAVLTPARYVDPSPSAAERAILDTSRSVFSEPVSLSAATEGDAMPRSTRTLRTGKPGAANLSTDTIDALTTVTALLPSLRSLFAASRSAQALAATLPVAVQRLESASGSTDGAVIGGGPTAALAGAQALDRQVSGYLRRVRILKPSSGSYTLASNNSPLPITVRNDLPYPVSVRIDLSAVGGLPGFSAPSLTTVVPADSKQTFRIRARLQRPGRIPVQAKLSTASGYQLGAPVRLLVRSTVLGAIGIVITIVAGAVLALALLVRYIRRVQRIRRKRGSAGVGDASPALEPQHETAS